MGKEIFSSNCFNKIFEQHLTQKEQLNEFARQLNFKYGIQLYFCEIIGKRWSFFAGDKTLDIPHQQIILNNHFGIMTAEIPVLEAEWKLILDFIKEKLNQ
jgi:hypothetical protein